MHPAPPEMVGPGEWGAGQPGAPVPAPSTRSHCPASVQTSAEVQRRGRNFPCGAEGSGLPVGLPPSLQSPLCVDWLTPRLRSPSPRPPGLSVMCFTPGFGTERRLGPELSQWGRETQNDSRGRGASEAADSRGAAARAPLPPHLASREGSTSPPSARRHTRARRGIFSLISLRAALIPPQSDREFRGDRDE